MTNKSIIIVLICVLLATVLFASLEVNSIKDKYQSSIDARDKQIKAMGDSIVSIRTMRTQDSLVFVHRMDSILNKLQRTKKRINDKKDSIVVIPGNSVDSLIRSGLFD